MQPPPCADNPASASIVVPASLADSRALSTASRSCLFGRTLLDASHAFPQPGHFWADFTWRESGSLENDAPQHMVMTASTKTWPLKGHTSLEPYMPHALSERWALLCMSHGPVQPSFPLPLFPAILDCKELS